MTTLASIESSSISTNDTLDTSIDYDTLVAYPVNNFSLSTSLKQVRVTETFRSLKYSNPNGYELPFTKAFLPEGFVSAIHVVSELLKTALSSAFCLTTPLIPLKTVLDLLKGYCFVSSAPCLTTFLIPLMKLSRGQSIVRISSASLDISSVVYPQTTSFRSRAALRKPGEITIH